MGTNKPIPLKVGDKVRPRYDFVAITEIKSRLTGPDQCLLDGWAFPYDADRLELAQVKELEPEPAPDLFRPLPSGRDPLEFFSFTERGFLRGRASLRTPAMEKDILGLLDEYALYTEQTVDELKTALALPDKYGSHLLVESVKALVAKETTQGAELEAANQELVGLREAWGLVKNLLGLPETYTVRETLEAVKELLAQGIDYTFDRERGELRKALERSRADTLTAEKHAEELAERAIVLTKERDDIKKSCEHWQANTKELGKSMDDQEHQLIAAQEQAKLYPPSRDMSEAPTSVTVLVKDQFNNWQDWRKNVGGGWNRFDGSLDRGETDNGHRFRCWVPLPASHRPGKDPELVKAQDRLTTRTKERDGARFELETLKIRYASSPEDRTAGQTRNLEKELGQAQASARSFKEKARREQDRAKDLGVRVKNQADMIERRRASAKELELERDSAREERDQARAEVEAMNGDWVHVSTMEAEVAKARAEVKEQGTGPDLGELQRYRLELELVEGVVWACGKADSKGLWVRHLELERALAQPKTTSPPLKPRPMLEAPVGVTFWAIVPMTRARVIDSDPGFMDRDGDGWSPRHMRPQKMFLGWVPAPGEGAGS